MAADPDLRDQLETAERLGISHKRFQGWEPRVETVYEYDEQGRLARSVTTTETEWDPEQQALMTALSVYRHLRCRRCGGDITETTAPENEGRYRALLPVRCHKCTALAAAESHTRNTTEYHPEALIHRVELAPPRGG